MDGNLPTIRSLDITDPTTQDYAKLKESQAYHIFDFVYAIFFNPIFVIICYFRNSMEESDFGRGGKRENGEKSMYKWNGIKNNTKNEQQKCNERHFVAFHSIALPFFLFGFRSVVYHLNVAIYLLYKFVIWCGTFDAMAAEMEEQQLEQETDNERKQNAEREKEICE